MLIFITLGVVALHNVVLCKDYHGYQALQVAVQTERQSGVLQQLSHDHADLLVMEMVAAGGRADIVVPPSLQSAVHTILNSYGMHSNITSNDLGAEMDALMEQNTINAMKSARSRTLQHTAYHDIYQVNAILREFANKHPNLAILRDLPLKTEHWGSTVSYLELGTAGTNKEIIFIEGLAHGREWIVPAALLYSIDTMLQGYESGDADAVHALETYTWIVIPVVNPDGYNFTWTDDRLWRKNRKRLGSGPNGCIGVDLNRNFDIDWGNVGVSFSCRDSTYPGLAPFSEAETQNVKLLFESVMPRVRAFLSVHAYSQLILYPWGYKTLAIDPNPPGNIQQLKEVGNAMKSAMDAAGSPSTYLVGTAYGVLGYAASGAAEDWALAMKPGIYAYCYELRPASASPGFLLPPDQILPTGQELLASLYVLAKAM